VEAPLEDYRRDLSNWGRWGNDDRRGTLNLVTEAKVREAASLVTLGRTVSCARHLSTAYDLDNPRPVVHELLARRSHAYVDYLGLVPHGYGLTHLDALGHVVDGDRTYNGFGPGLNERFKLELGIEAAGDGIVTRGVLLDLPGILNVDYLDLEERITPADLERAEHEAGITVKAGDALLVRTGRWRRRSMLGSWDPSDGLAGLAVSVLPWLRDRDIAILGCDGVSDGLPSGVADSTNPIHDIGVAAMGLHLLDNLDLEVVTTACRELGRWQFMFVVAALILEGGSGSPVNPIAIL
jgi:kynurenine formamidase